MNKRARAKQPKTTKQQNKILFAEKPMGIKSRTDGHMQLREPRMLF